MMRRPNTTAVDLRWFFNVAPGELGLRAVNLNSGGGGGNTENTSQAESAERDRRIKSVLNAIEPEHACTLRRHFTEPWSGWPPPPRKKLTEDQEARVRWEQIKIAKAEMIVGLEVFGTWARLALTSRVARKLFSDECATIDIQGETAEQESFLVWLRAMSKRNEGKAVPIEADRKSLKDICEDCSGRLARAIKAYETEHDEQEKRRATDSEATRRMRREMKGWAGPCAPEDASYD